MDEFEARRAARAARLRMQQSRPGTKAEAAPMPPGCDCSYHGGLHMHCSPTCGCLLDDDGPLP